jgi:hypothetical protein
MTHGRWRDRILVSSPTRDGIRDFFSVLSGQQGSNKRINAACLFYYYELAWAFVIPADLHGFVSFA